MSGIDSEAARHKARRNAVLGQGESAGKAFRAYGPAGLSFVAPGPLKIALISVSNTHLLLVLNPQRDTFVINLSLAGQR